MGGTTVLKRISGPGGMSGGLSSGGPSPGDVNVKYCQYPPTGSSSVSVTMEDYYCLEDESFLNDSVIDFYFKWLQFSGKLSDADAKRTHIFSTFFYKRLTTRPPKQKNKLHPIEDDVNKSAGIGSIYQFYSIFIFLDLNGGHIISSVAEAILICFLNRILFYQGHLRGAVATFGT